MAGYQWERYIETVERSVQGRVVESAMAHFRDSTRLESFLDVGPFSGIATFLITLSNFLFVFSRCHILQPRAQEDVR